MKRRWLRAMLCFAKGFVFCVFVFCFFSFVFWQGSWLRAMLCFDKGFVYLYFVSFVLCFDKGVDWEQCCVLTREGLKSAESSPVVTWVADGKKVLTLPAKYYVKYLLYFKYLISCQVLCCVKYLPYFKYLIWYLEYLKTSLQWGPRPSNSELTLKKKWKCNVKKTCLTQFSK